jgi:hypothetical protein
MSKTLNLTISERVSALGILNGFKGKLETLSVILEDIKGFVITEEEWEQADRKITVDGENSSWTWDNDKGPKKDVEAQEATVDYLRAQIKEKDEKGEFTPSDKAFITLKEKLG